jgi:hypothetical protein
MNTILEHYRVLGVNVGAGIADVTRSYKRLCRIYHPDISDDPDSEELMKKINIAYTVLREKLRREAAFRERQAYMRQPRRHPGQYYSRTDMHKMNAEAVKEASQALSGYFAAINICDYSGAYSFLSSYDRRHISRESFVEWRKAVARLYPMRDFKISEGQPAQTMTFGEGKSHIACKFRVLVTEEDIADDRTQSGDIEKIIINENGLWRVFLGYKGVGELTRGFDERYEARRKRDIARRWEEHYTGLYPEYDMLNISGMRKAAAREIYRQKRFGGTLTFAVLSVKAGNMKGSGQDELLRSAARTIVGALRETDVSAYAGDGVFAILFVELRKRNAGEIVMRLITRIRKNAGQQLGGKANIDYELQSWTGSNPADMDAMNKVLKMFRKKM